MKNTDIKRKRTGKISQSLYVISLVPMLAFALVIMFLGYKVVEKALISQVERELHSVAGTTTTLFNSMYPGDFELVGETAYKLMKGDTDITSDYELLDHVKEMTDLDLTLFFKDTRILTTIVDKNGARIVGTGAAEPVLTAVLNGGSDAFFSNSKIHSSYYYTYYMPLYNSDGIEVIGMLGVCKPASVVNEAINSVLHSLLLFEFLTMCVIMLLIMQYTKRLVNTLNKIHEFLSVAGEGDFTVELDASVLKRNDELGEIGESILTMHRSMRDLMEKDPLTKLFNRRSANRKLQAIISKAESTKTSYSISIGDIDHFKAVNDTYGHDAGDAVLVAVADTIREFMKSYGFVARWGGEEFLIVFDKASVAEAEQLLNELLGQIRDLKVEHEGTIITLTMSFGVSCNPELSVDDLVKSADEKLYYAKNNGRNRVVAALPALNTDSDGEDTMEE